MSKRVSGIFKGDKVIWMVFLLLCLCSTIEVFSASSTLTYKTGDYISPMIKHIGLLLVGVVSMLVTLNIPCRYFKVPTPFLIGGCFIALIIAAFAGHSVNGAGRWIGIGALQFQPSELAKGTMVLTTAQILSAMQTNNGADRHACNYIMAVWFILVPLIFKENLSTAALLSVVVFLMMYIGHVPRRQLLRIFVVVATCVFLFVTSILAFGDVKKVEVNNNNFTEKIDKKPQGQEPDLPHIFLQRMDTWKARIYKFADNKYIPPEKVDLDKDAQTSYANIAIASSSFLGKGFGNSDERDFLPQAFSDYIYAIIIEETGMLGAFIVAMLYIFLLFRAGIIANRCENNFPAFLVMGLSLLLVTQALFNMCVAVGLVPVTGQPLPLISKGGTASIINCIYIGVILSVSRTAKKNTNETAGSKKDNAEVTSHVASAI